MSQRWILREVKGRRSAATLTLARGEKRQHARRRREDEGVQNVRGVKIGVAENTESGICFEWKYIQYICTATDGRRRGAE